MEGGLNNILIISLILVTGCITIFLILLIQVANIIKRILNKIEIRIDNLDITQEEIKLKVLNFVEEILTKIKSYGKIRLSEDEAPHDLTVGVSSPSASPARHAFAGRSGEKSLRSKTSSQTLASLRSRYFAKRDKIEVSNKADGGDNSEEKNKK